VTQGAEWSGTIHQRIAEAIRRAREAQKLSAQQLADETQRLGYPITRSQIANYESGRKRRLDVAEITVLAAALNTSPVALLYPGPYDKEIEVLPGVLTTELKRCNGFQATVMDSPT